MSEGISNPKDIENIIQVIKTLSFPWEIYSFGNSSTIKYYDVYSKTFVKMKQFSLFAKYYVM